MSLGTAVKHPVVLGIILCPLLLILQKWTNVSPFFVVRVLFIVVPLFLAGLVGYECITEVFGPVHKRPPALALALRFATIALLVPSAFFCLHSSDGFQALLPILATVIFFELACKVRASETTWLRLGLRRYLRKNQLAPARNTAFRLHEVSLANWLGRTEKLSASQKRQLIKNFEALGSYRESIGDHPSAALYFDAALELIDWRTKRIARRVTVQILSLLCKSIRNNCIYDPTRADHLREVARQYSLVTADNESAENMACAGVAINPLGDLLTGEYDYAELILEQRNKGLLESEKNLDYLQSLSLIELCRRKDRLGKLGESWNIRCLLSERLANSSDPALFFVFIMNEREIIDHLISKTGYLEASTRLQKCLGKLFVRLWDPVIGSNERTLILLADLTREMAMRLSGRPLERADGDEDVVKTAADILVKSKAISGDVRLLLSRTFSLEMGDDLDDSARLIQTLRQEITGGWVAPQGHGIIGRIREIELEQVEFQLIQKRWPIVNEIAHLGNIEHWQDCLIDGEVLLDFGVVQGFEGTEYICMIYFSSGTDPKRVHLGATTILNESLDIWRKIVMLAAEPPVNNAAIAKIISSLVQPLIPFVIGAKRVIVSPDGALSRLAFEALRLSDGKLWLVDTEVIYVNSPRDLAKRRNVLPSPREPVVVTNPDFDWSGGPHANGMVPEKPKTTFKTFEPFQALTGAHEEGCDVAKVLGADHCSGRDATSFRVKQVNCPVILHLATHAFVFWRPTSADAGNSQFADVMKNPEHRTGLALAGINAVTKRLKVAIEIEDGILSAYEASALKLYGTRLVVLSGCDTGAGEIRQGDGVLGLRRAFCIAGASAVISCLWPAPDVHTRFLMNAFYERIIQGHPISAALREAKAEIRKSWPEPWYWAGFVLHEAGGACLSLPESFKMKSL